MRVDSDPLQIDNAHYTEPVEENMAKATEGLRARQKIKITDGLNMEVNMVSMSESEEANQRKED